MSAYRDLGVSAVSCDKGQGWQGGICGVDGMAWLR
jgi:hypothetical protein